MKKILYTRPNENGEVTVVIPAKKEDIELSLQQTLSESDYETLVWDKSVPTDAIKPRFINESDIPSDREFRNAWVDVTPLPQIDIDCEKARDIKLEELRRNRDEKLQSTDWQVLKIIEEAFPDLFLQVSPIRKALRDSTEALKNLDVQGKVNDTALLEEIRNMSVLNV